MLYIKGRMYPDNGGFQYPPALPKEFAPKFKSGIPSIYELELVKIWHEIDLKFSSIAPVPQHLAKSKMAFERIICLRRYKVCA